MTKSNEKSTSGPKRQADGTYAYRGVRIEKVDYTTPAQFSGRIVTGHRRVQEFKATFYAVTPGSASRPYTILRQRTLKALVAEIDRWADLGRLPEPK